MRLVGILVIRNESWILEASIKQALRWVDRLVVVDHASHDATDEIINRLQQENPYRISYSRWVPTEKKTLTSRFDADGNLCADSGKPGVTWEADVPIEDEALWKEQDVRQHGLLLARKEGATHIALIDADEMLTSNYIERVREDAEKLEPGEVLEVPLYCMHSFAEYQDDGSVWTNGQLSLVVRDKPELTFKSRDDGYWFHSRKPHGTGKCVQPYKWSDKIGAMHLQWVNRERILWKHRLYALTERLHWPDRDTVQTVNSRYTQALMPPLNLSIAPTSWFEGVDVAQIDITGWPWHKGECAKLLRKHGYERFKGLNIMGWPTAKDLVPV